MKKFLLSILALAASIAVTASNGALSGGFSINQNYDRVQFSKGNLQYKPSTKTFQFAERQYEYIGEGNAGISDSYNGWIDLFGWGTGNYPAKASTDCKDYTLFYDWGKNAIKNGGNASNLWRTLTSDEWAFIIGKRAHADKLLGLGRVDGVKGLILLPDKWTTPENLSFLPVGESGLWGKIKNNRTGYMEYVPHAQGEGDDYTNNHYTLAEWEKMEEAGAVFLPAAGFRGDKSDVYWLEKGGGYWSATWTEGNDVNCPNMYQLYFGKRNIELTSDDGREGASVRLVQTYSGSVPLDKFTVTFKDWDGKILKVQEVQIGKAATAPDDPEKDGYMFLDWDTDFSNVIEDITITAKYMRKGAFVINEKEDRIQFSKGNLQYQPSSKTWRFAKHQWDLVGGQSAEDQDVRIGNVYEGEKRCTNKNISNDYKGWIDLFGWGTGNNPLNTSSAAGSYSKFVDWGVNPISNGGNVMNAWRTLTHEEWDYILFKRPNADSLCSFAKIPDYYIPVLVLLPDDWELPEGVSFVGMKNLPSSTIEESAYTGQLTTKKDPMTCVDDVNNLSREELEKMEEAGAVFLPVTGYREGTLFHCPQFYYESLYWSSSNDQYIVKTFSARLCGSANKVYGSSATPQTGCAVRLVQPYDGKKIISSKTCGENLTWKLSNDSSVLIIIGTGDMTDFEAGKAPWYKAKYKIRQIILPEAITSIGDYAFKDCAEIQNPIVLPEGVTKIGESAFEGCWQIPFLTIGSNVTAIGDDAFYECSGLKQIICKNTTPPEISSWGAFYAVNTAVPIYVPTEDAVEAYKAATGWKHFTNFLCDKDKADAADVIAKIDAIGEVEYSGNCKDLIVAAREAYDALSDAAKSIITASKYKVLTDAEAKYEELKKAAEDQKIANIVISLIDAIGEVKYSGECKGNIDAARSAYDALTDDQKALITDEQYKVLTDAEAKYGELKTAGDKEAADYVIGKIDAIGEVAYTDESKALIDAAREAYDDLIKDQQALITDEQYKVLTDAEAKYEELKETAEKKAAADKKAADAVIAMIDAIGTVEYTDESKAHIDAARKAYDALTDDQKALVTAEQYKVLTDAEAKYEELKKAAEDKVATDAVIAKIDAIGEVAYTDESKALIDAAREAYNALTDDQKALVTAEQLKVLTDAEAKYAELKEAADKAAADKKAADDAIAKIDAIGEVAYTDESKALIDAARKAYDALTDDQKALVTAEQYRVLTDAEAKYEELKKAAEEFIALTPQNLQVAKEDKDGDVLITLSWDKVNGAISYELRVSANGNELFSQNTMTLNVITRQLSALEKEYKLIPGTYTIDWSVRSTDALGIPMSDWAEGESFEVTVKDPATGVDEIVNRKSSNRKLIIDGVLYIEHNGKILDATGRLVKE
ncbi:MAG: leucine-rich repeat protein [Paludibacteraceae bacterium]|nr:leucine-rich repeat protein [Paludibacteraceae bacterium]